MKNFICTVAITCVIGLSAQVDYYDYTETNIYTGVTTNANSVPLAKDEGNNIFYIDNFNDPSGMGKIHKLQNLGASWSNTILHSTAQAKAANGLLYTAWKIFFVGADDKIRNLYQSSGVWYDAYLNINAPAVLAGTNLTTDPAGNIYYVGSDKKLYKFWWAANTWNYALLNFPYGYPALTKANQKILFNVDRIFYVGDSDGKIYNALQSGSNWLGGGALNSTATVASKSSFYADASGKLFFVGSDQKLRNIVWTSANGWQNYELHPGAPKVAISNEFTVKGDEIYYAATDINWGPQIYCMYWDECKWKWTDLRKTASLGSKIKPNSSLLFDSNNKLFYGCNNNTISYLTPPINEATHPYVYVKGKKLMDHGIPFEVKCVNYIAEVYSTNNTPTFNSSETLYIGPCQHYQPLANVGNPTSTGVADGITKVRADFAKIKSEGFNTVRLMGNFLAGLKDRDICTDENASYQQISHPTDEKIYFHKSVPTTADSCTQWYTDIEYNAISKAKLFAVLDDLVYCAEQEGLKLILTTGFMNGDNPNAFDEYATYLGEIANYLKNKTAIIAYDYWNEPNILFYMAANYNKATFCQATNSWYSAIRANSPSQLVTVGLYSTYDYVHNWDPAIISTDFVGFHPYAWRDASDPTSGTGKITVPEKRWDNALTYMSRIMYDLDKPWIIEETSFLAGDDVNDATANDWGTEQDQENFAQHMMIRAKNCGTAGWAWWQWRDVYWDTDPINKPGENFLGLIDHNGNDKKILVDNTFVNPSVTQSCDCNPHSNYYNPFNESNFAISGVVKDINTGLPLKNAFIYGAGSTVVSPVNWDARGQTISQDDGSFTVSSTYRLTHYLNIAAPGYEKVSIPWNVLASTCGSSYTTCNIGTVNLTPVNCYETNYKMAKPESKDDLTAQQSGEVICYPNPSTGMVMVKSDVLMTAYSISDIRGTVIDAKDSVNQNNFEINLKGQASGVYYIRINAGGKIITRKIVLL